MKLRAGRGIIVDLLPRRSAVFRNKKAAGLARRLDRRVDDFRIVRRDSQADAPHVFLRQAFFQLRPIPAAVGRLVDG